MRWGSSPQQNKSTAIAKSGRREAPAFHRNGDGVAKTATDDLQRFRRGPGAVQNCQARVARNPTAALTLAGCAILRQKNADHLFFSEVHEIVGVFLFRFVHGGHNGFLDSTGFTILRFGNIRLNSGA